MPSETVGEFTLKSSNLGALVPLIILGVLVLTAGAGVAITKWLPHERAKQYLPLFEAAAAKFGIPVNLLLRVAMQESSFLPDVISGKKQSSAGAVGIMQIVPKWHPSVDPTKPEQAVPYAAKYLVDLKKQFGTWERALAAYNWGSGNLQKFLDGKLKTMPAETVNYVSKIMRDIV